MSINTYTIGVFKFKEAHTALNLSREIKNILADWGIEIANVSCIITDGAANIKKAAQDIIGPMKYLHCFAHAINLTALGAMKKTKELNETITKVKDCVTYYRHNIHANVKLREIQNGSVKQALKLKQECPTRWNSLFYIWWNVF